MAKLTTIKINKDRHGNELRGGINGRIYKIPTGSEQNVEPELVEHLRSSGVSFEEVSGGDGSKEGSGDPSPIFETDGFDKPHMAPRSEDNQGGGQSGDVTAAAEAPDAPEADPEANTIAARAEISDARVAQEQRIIAGATVNISPEQAVSGPFDHDGDGKPGGAPKGGNKPAKK